MTNLLLDKMKRFSTSTVPARIINITCGKNNKAGIYFPDLNFMNKDYNWKDAYFQSKSAILLFTHELAKRTKGDTAVFFTILCIMFFPVTRECLPIQEILPSPKKKLRGKWRNQKSLALFGFLLISPGRTENSVFIF